MSKVTEVVGRKFAGRKNKEQGCTHKKTVQLNCCRFKQFQIDLGKKASTLLTATKSHRKQPTACL